MATNCMWEGLAGCRMAAKGVRPDAGPRPLGQGATGEQDAAAGVEHIARKPQMQGCLGVVDWRLLGCTGLLAVLIEHHDQFRVNECGHGSSRIG
jgi:hypothetical protein